MNWKSDVSISSRRKIRAVIFDLDNTLIKSKIGEKKGLLIAAQLIAKRLATKNEHFGYHRLLKRLLEINKEMLGWKQRYNRDLWWKTLLKDFQLHPSDSQFLHQVTLEYWKAYANAAKPFSDAASTIHRLKSEGYKLGVVSDSDGTPGMKKLRFRRQPFHNLFDTIVIAGEDTPRVKPGHESFLLIAKRLRMNPHECIYIGDNPRTDINGAKAVGMISVIVKRRGNDAGNPNYRINSLRETPRLLRTIQAQ